MVDIQRLIEWANTGAINEPNVGKQNQGYLGGEQPFEAHHNYLFNRSTKYDNQAVDFINRRGTLPPTLNESTQFSNNLWPVDWIHPYSTFNTVTFANSVTYLAPGWNALLSRPIVYASFNGLQQVTEIRNALSFLIETEVHTLNLTNGDEEIEAFCADASYLYVLTSRPANPPHIYAFPTDPWSSTPAYDNVLPSIIDSTGQGRNNLILADNTWLAIPTTNATADQYCVYLVRKDGTAGVRSGRGNAPNSSAYRVTTGLCSNGTNLFFAVTDLVTPTQNTLLCTANIADPTQATNPGGAVTNKDTGVVAGAESLIYDGNHVHLLNANGQIFSYDWNQDIVDSVFSFFIANTPQPQTFSDGPHMVFDGLNAWAVVEYDGTNDRNGFAIPIRLADVCLDLSTSQEVKGPRIFLHPPNPANAMVLDSRLAYSDNCLWTAPRGDIINQNLSVYRIPNLIARY